MAQEFIIAIDQGTTGTRVNCIDEAGRVVGSAYEEFTQYFPKPGWVEHDAEEIWVKLEKLLSAACADGGLDPAKTRAIGITNQRETTVIWDRKTGRPVHKAIVWQCRRTTPECEKLEADGHGPLFQEKTGLKIDAYFSGTKVAWILDNVPGARERAEKGELAFGTIDSWLLYNMTGGQAHKTDFTNASRTLMYNIREKKWDPELLKILNIPQQLLPEVENCAAEFGETNGVAGFPDGIPILAMIGDQQGALVGNLCFEPGESKNTYGTGCFLLVNMGDHFKLSESGLLTILVSDADGKPAYGLEGSIFIGGAVVQWLRDSLRTLESAPESEDQVAKIPPEEEDDGVVFVPAFAGLGAPYWDMQARGAIFGLTRGTTRENITRAALKSIALQTRDILLAMEKDAGLQVDALRVDGGATANNYLMQYQADILDKKVLRPKNLETTALGSAFLAGLRVGFWKDAAALRSKIELDQTFSPAMSPEKRDREVTQWREAVNRVLTSPS